MNIVRTARFSGETGQIGNIAMPISASRPHAVDDLMRISNIGVDIVLGDGIPLH